MAIAMAKVTAVWCREQSRPGPKGENHSPAEIAKWLCSKDGHQYFRSVYVTGGRGPHGLVCESNGTSGLRFFGMDLVEDLLKAGDCVVAEVEGEGFQLWVHSTGDDGDS
jgi:hypothetical protein